MVVFFNVFFPLNNKNNKGVGNFSNKTQWQKYLQLTAKHFLPFGRRDFTFVSLLLFYFVISFFSLTSTAHAAYELFISELLAFETFVGGDERASGISYLYSISN